jgi:RHH-type rel operon transcriptional repressor/antitoxin RelB
MPHVSVRVTEDEKNLMESYSKLHGINVSDAIKEAFFGKLEGEYDLKIIKEYEAEKARGNMKYYSLDEVEKELGLDDGI